MRNQFFYTTKEVIPPTEEGAKNGQTEVVNIYTNSFNLDKVIRTVQMEKDKLIVLLDDIHERPQEVPNINPKTHKYLGTKMQRQVVQSEITLEGEDVLRFKELTQIS